MNTDRTGPTDSERDTAEQMPDEGMRTKPTDIPEVPVALGAEQPAVAAGLGVSGFAKQNPEGGLTGDEDTAWQRDALADDDQTDNDGETVRE